MHNSFGGKWTELKLKCLEQYIKSYTTALKYQNFDLVYIDLFAGSGKREERTDKSDQDQLTIQEFGLDDEAVYEGSATIALKYAQAFKKFEFAEKKKKNAKKLHELRDVYPGIPIEIHNGEADEVLPKIINHYDWQKTRAILFLDPYGCQVKFEMLQRLVTSGAKLDVFYLFPCGAISRLANNDGNIDPDRERKITEVFGDEKWKKDFYEIRKPEQASLFTLDETPTTNKAVSNGDIVFNFINRLKRNFAYADPEDLILKNSRNSHMFSLCFFMTNKSEKAIKLAPNLWKGVLKSVKT